VAPVAEKPDSFAAQEITQLKKKPKDKSKVKPKTKKTKDNS